jgi:hypothetical protein
LPRHRNDVEAEFGGDHDLASDGRKRLADQFLDRERATGFGGGLRRLFVR